MKIPFNKATKNALFNSYLRVNRANTTAILSSENIDYAVACAIKCLEEDVTLSGDQSTVIAQLLEILAAINIEQEREE